VAALVIYRSGRRKDLRLRMFLPGTRLGLGGTIGSFSLRRRSAVKTLHRIAEGTLGRSILPWVPLMAEGGKAAAVQEWMRLASQEPDSQRRNEYAGLALVFANWAGHGGIWNPALEAWNVERIPIVEEWKNKARNEGRLEERRIALLAVLRTRFAPEVPPDITQAVQQTTDLDTLARWFDAALTASSLDAFRAVIQPPPANGTAPSA
jgi:hypothetical protein